MSGDAPNGSKIYLKNVFKSREKRSLPVALLLRCLFDLSLREGNSDTLVLMIVNDASSASRHVFLTGHNDGLCGVLLPPIELPMHALKTREI